MENKPVEIVTFYLIGNDGKVDTRNKFITSPFSREIRGRTPAEDTYEVQKIEFKDGIYETADPQEIEYLRIYNKGGILSNGKKIYGDRKVHVIAEQKPKDTTIVEKTVTEKVMVEKIPKIIAETMTVAQLKQLAGQWKVELGEALKKEEIIEKLTDSEHLS